MRAIPFMALVLAALATGGCRHRTHCEIFEDSASGGTRCSASWSECEDGSVRVVTCTDGGRCGCEVDGYTGRRFTRARFCDLEGEGPVTAVANDECSWDLEVGAPGLQLPF